MKPRSAFLLVLYAACANGCGTSSSGGSSSMDGGGADGGGLADGSSTNCPSSIPTPGQPCPGLAGLSCGYAGTECSPCSATAICTNGSWQVELPPCRAASPPCPATLPEAGTPCSWTC